MPIFPAGSEHLTDDATGSQIAGVLNRVQNYLVGAGGMTGMIIDYAGPTAPTGWLVCDGSPVSRTTYAALFTAIGIIWGAGDGSTTFNLPDLRDRVSLGLGSRVLAAVGGAETHALTQGELASHTHVQNAHTHPRRTDGVSEQSLKSGVSGNNQFAVATSQSDHDAQSTTGQQTATNQSTGSGTAHNNMQPYAVVQKLIKT